MCLRTCHLLNHWHAVILPRNMNRGKRSTMRRVNFTVILMKEEQRKGDMIRRRTDTTFVTMKCIESPSRKDGSIENEKKILLRLIHEDEDMVTSMLWRMEDTIRTEKSHMRREIVSSELRKTCIAPM